ncbi:MAG TPA: MFS transporter [Acidimicrobiales bacterium]|nr:MFS transporter [Acidimicrobiales bacterium]
MADTGWEPLRAPRETPSGPGGQNQIGHLGSPAFARLALTHALVMAGDTLITLALAGSLFFSISPTAARSRVVLSLLLTMAPFAVVAPVLGPAIDRARRGKRVMVVTSAAGRVIVCLAMSRVVDSLLLFPTAFAALVLSKAYSVAKSALVPASVQGHEELVEANSKLAIGGVVAGFVASVPAVALLHFAGARPVLVLAGSVFAVAAVAGLRVIEEPATVGFPADDGSAEAARPAHVVLASFGMAVLRGIVGFITFLVAFDFRRADAPSWWFGVVLAASMAGTMLGSFVAPRIRRTAGEERMLMGSLLVVGALAALSSGSPGRASAAVLAGVVGVAASVAKLAFDALVQRDAPGREHGRSFARFEATFQLAWVAGALVPSGLDVDLDVGFALIAVAAIAMTVATIVLGRPRRPGRAAIQS